MSFKKILLSLIPPIISYIYKKIKKSINNKNKNDRLKKYLEHGWYAGFKSYEEVKKISEGYDADVILRKCSCSLLKVKNGEAVYERDSVLFDKIQYSYPLLTSLIWIASKSGNKLDIIDFGGSLGSSYFQNYRMLSHLDSVKWNIVEQENFIVEGKKNFQDNNLKFYFTIKDCLKENKPNAILFSSVIQYIENPYMFLDNILAYNFEYIIFDLTGFVESQEDILTLQVVPETIYNANYPCRFFNEEKFKNIFLEKYDLIIDFECSIGADIEIFNYPYRGKYRGFLFELKKR